MDKGLDEKAKKILTEVRERIDKAACGDADAWFKINRYVYARLQLDERKTKPKKVDLFDSQKGLCWICKKRIDNIKDTDTHRLEAELGYGEKDSVVLVHRKCHQQIQTGGG